MRELRSELEAYTAADEPPMRLAFDDVMTAAKRKRLRRRSTVVATGVAAVAAVGIAVPVLLMAPDSSPGPAAAPTADCKAELDRTMRVACVARARVQPYIGSLKLESPKLSASNNSITVADGAAVPIDVELPVTNGTEAVGSVTVQVGPEQPGACPEYCTALASPEGWAVYSGQTPSENPAVIAYARQHRVLVRSTRFDRTNPRSAGPLLTIEQMTWIATTPELLP